MSRTRIVMALLAAVVPGGCATPPMGPSASPMARVLPAPARSFEEFAMDQGVCKQFASGEVAGGATVSNLKQFGAAAVGTALGAGLGAAVRGGRGAEIGGGFAALAGGLMAANGSARDQGGLQARYDVAYTQCMAAKGNRVPAQGQVASAVPAGYPQPGGPASGRAYGPMVFTPGYGPIR
jgi:hypothetical protein